MTLEITEYRCRACGHLLGKEEYFKSCLACDQIVKKGVQQKEREIQMQAEEKSRLQIQNLQQLLIRKDKEQRKLLEENIRTTRNEDAALFRKREQQFEQVISQYQLSVKRAENHSRQVEEDNRKLQKQLQTSVHPESKGTAGEYTLLNELSSAFPQDHFTSKRVGEEMPDIIQTVVTKNGEKVGPILWDMKTGEKIESRDIRNAKRYKEKYNTENCVIVTAESRSINDEDSKRGSKGLIGERDGITLVHQSAAVGIAKLTREFIIEKIREIKNNDERASKQIKLYDYIASPERVRKLRIKIQSRAQIEESIRLQQVYNKKAWNEQTRIINEWSDLDTNDQDIIDRITQCIEPGWGKKE